MTHRELLQIPGLGDLLTKLERNPPPAKALEPPPKCQPSLAAPGEVWRVVETDQQTQGQDYSRTNPHCSTVLILKREEDLDREHAVFRVAPVLADIRYCGVQDAIFPREVFGYEAAVACGCEFMLTSKELVRCEGVLPDKWFDRLADFAAWMEAEDGKTAPPFPPLLKTGRPFTHHDDPGYIFHANLARNLQPLMATVMEELVEPKELPEIDPQTLQSVVEDEEDEDYPIRLLAAGESNLPKWKDVSHLMPGFTGRARESGEATVLTFSCPVRSESQPPSSFVASGSGDPRWPDDRRPCSFRDEYGLWMAEIEIELRWDVFTALDRDGKIVIVPAE